MSDQKPVQIVVPLPPSVNSYWTRGKSWGGKATNRRSQRALSFLLLGDAAIRQQGSPAFGADQVVVSIMLHTRTGTRGNGGDLDNFNKGLLDLLTHSGVWDDDDQVMDLRIERRGKTKGGAAVITIRKATKAEIGRMSIVETMVAKLKEWGLI